MPIPPSGVDYGLLPLQRQVLETHHFTDQIAKLGSIERIDEALAAVQLILTENAELYPVVKGFEKTRLAKTNAVDDVPALNIWFMIDEEHDSVILLYVEPVPTD